MNRQFLFSIAFLFFVLASCNPQNDRRHLILGTWELVDNEQNIIMYFQENHVLDYQQNDIPYKDQYFFQSDSMLLLGNTLYKIISLSDYDLWIAEMHFGDKYHYKKTVNKIKPIKEYEPFTFTYPNGQKKIQGQNHNGIRDGKWTEWYENGQIKSIERFFDGVPLGLQEYWYENGVKKEERTYKINMSVISTKCWDENGKLIFEEKKSKN